MDSVISALALGVSSLALYLSWRAHISDVGQLHIASWSYQTPKSEEGEFVEIEIVNLGRRVVFLKNVALVIGRLTYQLIGERERGKIQLGEGELKYLRTPPDFEQGVEFFMTAMKFLKDRDDDPEVKRMLVVAEETRGWRVEVSIDWETLISAYEEQRFIRTTMPITKNRRTKQAFRYGGRRKKLPHARIRRLFGR